MLVGELKAGIFGLLAALVACHLGRHATAGSVIDGSQVSVEINDVFKALLTVLKTSEPQKVNATLTALGTALGGNGTRFGDFMVSLNRYLRQTITWPMVLSGQCRPRRRKS